MENINRIRLIKQMQIKFLTFGLLLAFLFACDTQAPEDNVKHEPFTVLIQKISSETPSGGLTTEPYLQGIQCEQVQGFPDRSAFFVAERVSKITHFPCGECHTQMVSELKELENSNTPKAHWNIRLQHAGKDLMNCQTCHPNSRMNTLRSLQGASIEFNHAYQLCAQCHFQQARD
ncbi:MAG TPA: cytochrome c3 family protein, partial [SAR324 cluster bacterium]|nr:cytochrome c3 family protein [SAR324 cluster bacterium]